MVRASLHPAWELYFEKRLGIKMVDNLKGKLGVEVHRYQAKKKNTTKTKNRYSFFRDIRKDGVFNMNFTCWQKNCEDIYRPPLWKDWQGKLVLCKGRVNIVRKI
jgi:hypothetical protein